MKNIYILALCIIAAICSTAQTTFSIDIQNFQFPDMLQAANKDVVYISSNTAYKGLLLVRVSPKNKIKFSKLIIDSPYRINFPSIIETSDKGFAVSAKEFRGSTDCNVVLKFDSAGNLLWQKRFYDGYIYYDAAGAVVCEAPDKSLYVAAGNRATYHELIKFSSSGSIIWHRRFANTTGSRYAYDAITADAENVYFCLNEQCGDCISGLPDIFKVSAEGKLVWEKNLSEHNYVVYMQALGNDILNMIIRYNEPPKEIKYVVGAFNLAQLSNTRNVIAENIFSLTDYYKKNNLTYLKGKFIRSDKVSSGYFINDDWSVSEVGDRDIKKYDKFNRICPDFVTPVVDTTVKKRTVLTSDATPIKLNDSNFTVIGSDYVSINVTIPFDVVCSGNASNVNAAIASSLKSNNTIFITPNPVKDVLKISSQNASFKNVVIINASGKVVMKNGFAGSNYPMNVSSLGAGVYYVRVTENDGKSEAVKIIKQ